MPAHLLLIDASGFAYRAFHGGLKFPRYRESDGMPTGAIVGFLEIIYRLLVQAQADPISHVAAIFDAPGKTFRHEIFPAYKSNRSERDPELSVQLPIMREAARALGLPVLELVGWEADDIIATMARRGVEAGLRVTIVSSDKDMGQLVQNTKIEIVDSMANKRVVEADVEKKMGVPPRLVQDMQALCGDAIDHIPGVDGIGSLTAAKLIRKLGSLEAVMAEAKKATGYRMTASAKLAINKAANALPLYLRLTTLERHVPIEVQMHELAVQPIEKRHLDELLRALGANKRFSQVFSPPRTDIAELVPRFPGDAFAWHTAAVIEYQKKLKSPSYKITLQAPDTPQCGWYKRRLVKGGPWVPARVWREQAIDFETDKPGNKDHLYCTVGDVRKNAVDQWGWLLNCPITKEDFDFMVEHRAWVKTYGAAGEPEKAEDKPINWDTVPI